MKHDIFVSFSFKDYDLVEKIISTLEKEYNVKAWMCSKELYGGDKYYAIIPTEIRNSRVFVFFQSKDSLSSKEVQSEISLAFHSNRVIIPFLIDTTSKEGADIEYFLENFNYVDGTKPTLDKRIDDLSQSIYSALNKYSESSHLNILFKEKLLSSKTIFPTKSFVGRKDVIEEIENRYNEGHHVVFLHGTGGIGKTQVAKKYVLDHRDEYETVIFTTYEGNVKELVINESSFVLEPQMIRKSKEDGSLESDDEFFIRKLKKIKALSDERTLIIIDNLDESYKEEFKELFDGPYRLLITTRVSYANSEYAQVEINPLDNPNELIDLFFNNYDCDLITRDDKHLLELLKMVNYHTYTIELLAKHMANSLQSVDEMIEALKKEGIKSINEEVINSDMKTSIAYQNLLKMYKISDLNEQEIDALRFMLFVPIDGVPLIYIKMWGGSDIFKTIRELEKRSWIIKGSNGYTLHPIVYEIVKNNIDVNYNNCKVFLDNYDRYITHEASWNFKKIEKELYASFAYKILEYFPNIFPEIEELYYDIECLLSFATNATYGVKLANRLFDYYKNKNGEEDYYTARSAYKIGWDHIFNTELPNSLETAKKWILYSYGLFNKVNRPLTTYEKISFYNMARHVAKVYQFLYKEYHQEEDYEKAIHYALWALDRINNEEDEEVKCSRTASLNIQVSDVYLVHNEFEKALYYEQEAERTAGEVNDDLLYHLTRKAMCYVGLNKYQEALDIANECLYGYIEKDGKYNTNTLNTYNIMLNCYKALGDSDRVKEVENEITNIRKVLFA
ncbi:MAG: TIR domain-containing protein [Bacilli bacterium]|nr:TIR domain-containing protein [Bacilli bacterium]